MTVNTLGTDSSKHELPLASRETRTVAELLWPFLALGAALFSISALFYYHLNQADLIPHSALQRTIAALYHAFGLAPTVLFFLLVASWATIWFATGVLERPGARLLRLAIMAVMLGVFLNLGDGGVVPAVHKGEFGAWLAGRLVGAIGYVPSLALVWITTFASLLLATDWFFSDMFERARRGAPAGLAAESGVEAAVTDHLRGLSQAVGAAAAAQPAAGRAAIDVVVDDADDVDEAEDASPGASAQSAPDAVEDAEAAELRASYAERRRLRAARREFVSAAEIEAQLQSDADAEEAGAPAASDELVSEEELQSLFADAERAWDEAPAAPLPVAERAWSEAAAAPSAEQDAEEADDEGVEDDDIEDDDIEDDVEDPFVAEGAVRLDASVALESTGEAERAEAVAEAEEVEEVEEVEELDADVEDDAADEAAVPPSAVVGWSAFAPEPSASEVRDDSAAAPAAHVAPADEQPSEDGVVAESSEIVELPVDRGVDGAAEAEQEVGSEADADVETEPEAFEGDAEPTIAIPRPDVQPTSLPRAPSTRQQQLFGGADEQLVQEAIELVTGTRRATATLLQRKLRIDYELARELLAELAQRGVVALDGDTGHGRVLEG